MIRELFISTVGNDGHSGLLPEPPINGWDGPLASLEGARRRLREYKRAGRLAAPVTVFLRGGHYAFQKPVVFADADSWPTIFSAWNDDRPVLSGSQALTGWKQQVREDGARMWVTEVPEVREGKWNFKSLFINGRRAARPTLPQSGHFKIEDVPGCKRSDFLWHGCEKFVTSPGDLTVFRNLTDIDVLVPHFWVEERLPIASWNPETRLLTSTRKSTGKLTLGWETDWAPYQLENVFESLREPGQWYLDRPSGILYYLPLPDEQIEAIQAYAPRLSQLILLRGDADAGRYVEHLCFRGLHFSQTDWQQPDGPGFDADYIDRSSKYGTDVQAAATVAGVIDAESARYISIQDCTFSNLGQYAVNLGSACDGFRVVGNHMFDLGAGGVKVLGAGTDKPVKYRSDHHRITDNFIHGIGKVFKSGIGIALMHSAHNLVSHNEIHDTHYSAISVGWIWGFAESNSHHNVIEYNHLYDLGKGVLADLGGVYTLGVQPGTIIRNNLIHDIRASDYGAWGIYPDEGSAYLVIENNIVHSTQSAAFHQHFGRENIVRNNIFAFGGEGVVMLSRSDEQHSSLMLINNIIVSRNQPAHHGGHSNKLDGLYYFSDLNILWDYSANSGTGGEPMGSRKSKWHGSTSLSLAEMRKLGYDRHSIVADPGFGNIGKFDFSLREDSPAFAIGFKAIDISNIGPRKLGSRD